MTNIYALLLTLLVGAFFLIGILITKFTTRKKELTLFATGLSFVIMMGLILFDIIPEIAENVVEFSILKKWLIIIGFTSLGIIALKALDIFIPHHHHNHHDNEKNKTEHNEHLFHIGFVTSISLILHNIIEGISIYITGLTDIKLGLMMTLAVALHNIPLGIEIAVGLSSSNQKKRTKLFSIILLTISSFLGAFLLFVLELEMNAFFLSALLCITFGMLLYIALFELLKELWMERKNHQIYFGMALGVLITIVMVMV